FRAQDLDLDASQRRGRNGHGESKALAGCVARALAGVCAVSTIDEHEIAIRCAGSFGLDTDPARTFRIDRAAATGASGRVAHRPVRRADAGVEAGDALTARGLAER